MTHERWDVVDRDGNVVGQMEKGGCRVPEGFYHQAVEVIPTDGQGHILMTQRALNKHTDPGAWEVVAGSVLAGEAPAAAAIRELREETGLSPYKLKRLGRSVVPGLIRYAFVAYIQDLPNSKVTLQEEETISYRITSYQGWLDTMNQGRYAESRSVSYTDTFLEAVRKAVGEPEKATGEEQPPAPKSGIVRAAARPF